MQDRKIGLAILGIILISLLGLRLLSQAELGRIAYIQRGNLWVKELPDHKPRQLTKEGGISTPRWSPTGSWLLFQKNNQLWVTGEDGFNTRLVTNEVQHFRWLPVKDVIIYTTAGNEMFLTSPFVQNTRKLVGAESGQILGRMACSPDGRYVAFERFKQKKFGLLEEAGLWKVNTVNGKARVVYDSGLQQSEGNFKAMPRLARWTPDGKQLLFWLGPSSASVEADGLPLYKVSSEGGNSVPVASEEPVLINSDTVVVNSIGGNSNQEIAVIFGGGRETWTAKSLSVVDCNTPKSKVISRKDQAVGAAAFSPMGGRLVYSANPEEAWSKNKDVSYEAQVQKLLNKRRIWLVNEQNGISRQLTNDPNYRDEHPFWTVDGEHVLFARFNSENRVSLWLMRPDGSKLNQVVNELSPAPKGFGFYGYVDLGQLYDYWGGVSPLLLGE